MAESWVINASPVILLAKVGLIEHLSALVQRLVLPEPVAEEIRNCETADAAVQWVNGNGRAFLEAAPPELPELSSTRLGSGERSVIAWAVANPGFVAVLDDAGARAVAVRKSVPTLGTVGVVLKIKRAGLIPTVKPYLLEIRTVGGFIGDTLFRQALLAASEQP